MQKLVWRVKLIADFGDEAAVDLHFNVGLAYC